MTKAEWSGWAQAIFSALAIYIAIRVAAITTQRELEREAQVRNAHAFVVRTSVFMAINSAEGVLKRMRARWDQALINDVIVEDAKLDVARLDGIELPADDQLILLAHSHPSGAQFLVLARSQCSHLRVLVNQYAQYQSEGILEKSDLASMVLQISEVIDYLDQSVEEINGQGKFRKVRTV